MFKVTLRKRVEGVVELLIDADTVEGAMNRAFRPENVKKADELFAKLTDDSSYSVEGVEEVSE